MPTTMRFSAALVAIAAAVSVVAAAPADAGSGRTPKSTATVTSGVSVSGGRLLLNGKPKVFDGINAYNATT